MVRRSDGSDGEDVAFYGDNIYGSSLTGNRVYIYNTLSKNMYLPLCHIVIAALSSYFYYD